MSKTAMAVAAVLAFLMFVVTAICVGNRTGDEIDAIVAVTTRFLGIPLMVVALMALFTALRGGDAVAPAILVAAVALLGLALVRGMGEWGAPLGLAACVIAANWPRRAPPPPAPAPSPDAPK